MSQVTSIKVSVYAFGVSKDIIGKKQFEMSIPEDSSVSEFKQLIVDQYPRFRDITGFHIAIGDEYARDEDSISNDDQLSILPPVSGG